MEGKSMLLLLMVAIVIASVEANNETCCYQKIFPDGSYTLKESNSAEVAAYGCDTANSCVYVKDGTNDRYCMKMGGMSVPDCELKPCEEYLIALAGGTNQAPVADGFATDCKPPTFDFPSSLFAMQMAKVDGDVILLTVAAVGMDPQVHMMKIQANGRAENLSMTFPNKFPAGGALLTNWGPKKLLAVGGYDSSNNDKDGVFMYENGAWTDLGWTLDIVLHEGYGCTYGDRLVTVGGLNFDQHQPDQPTNVDKLIVYDLGNSGAVLKKLRITGAVKSCACRKEKVYFVTDGNPSLFSYNLAGTLGEKMETPTSPAVKHGRLGLFRGEITLFGGNTTDTIPIPVKTMQVYNYTTDEWTEKPFEMNNIQGNLDNFVVVEK